MVVVKSPPVVVSTYLSPCLKAAVKVLELGRSGTWQNAHNKFCDFRPWLQNLLLFLFLKIFMPYVTNIK